MSAYIITTISDAYIYLIAGWIDQIRSDHLNRLKKIRSDQISLDHHLPLLVSGGLGFWISVIPIA